MTHFPIAEYEQLTDPKAQVVYDEILTELGFGIVPNLFKSMAANPDLLEANWKKFRATILQGDVPRTLKVLKTAQLQLIHEGSSAGVLSSYASQIIIPLASEGMSISPRQHLN